MAMIDKDPHDFYALRELMLSAAHLNDMDELALGAEAKHFAYNSKTVKEVCESAPEEDKEYFSLNRDLERIEAAMRLTEDTRRDYYIKAGKGSKWHIYAGRGSGWHPKAYFIFVWCSTAFFLILELIIAGVLASSGTGGEGAFMAVFGGLTILIGIGVNFGYVFPRFKIMKEIDTYMDEFKAELSLTEEKIQERKAEAEELSEDISRGIRELEKTDSMRVLRTEKI